MTNEQLEELKNHFQDHRDSLAKRIQAFETMNNPGKVDKHNNTAHRRDFQYYENLIQLIPTVASIPEDKREQLANLFTEYRMKFTYHFFGSTP